MSAPDAEDHTSHQSLALGNQEFPLGEPIPFTDPFTGGSGEVTFNSIELKQTCFDTYEEADLPPHENGTPTGEIWAHYVGILESPEASSNEVYFPEGNFIDSNGNTSEAMWNTECSIGERSYSSPIVSVLPGEKRRIEHWREVPANIEKYVFDLYEFDLSKDESTS